MGVDYEEMDRMEDYLVESRYNNHRINKNYYRNESEPDYSNLRHNLSISCNIKPQQERKKSEIITIKKKNPPKEIDNFKRLFSISSNPISRKSSTISKEELKIFKKGDKIRKIYYSRLISKNIWSPNLNYKSKFKYNSLIIFDWDDTLFPSTTLKRQSLLKKSEINYVKDLLQNLNNLLYELLNLSLKNSENVYIITNSQIGWVDSCFFQYFDKVSDACLKKIKIISARNDHEGTDDDFDDKNDENEEKIKNDEEHKKMRKEILKKWKMKSFEELESKFNKNLLTNIMVIGDSEIEMEAGKNLGNKFREYFLKLIKFKETPNIHELENEINYLIKNFENMYAENNNIEINLDEILKK